MMNRPEKELYLYEHNAYVSDLEKYCNFLEWKLEATNEALNDHIKALDKACELLTQCASKCTGDNSNCHYSHCRECSYAINTKEQWKEWLLNDD